MWKNERLKGEKGKRLKGEKLGCVVFLFPFAPFTLLTPK